ncbi:MAG TPA: hypothetical protein PKK33_08245, partial [Candidatus Cloacimonadota bacterium]|nr:hypothetical protein [Candidatus Cloacimonadota bacterium]
MSFLIIMLKGFAFIIFNMLGAFFIVYSVKLVLFKRHPFSFFGKQIPITQGYIVRKRNWVLDKLRFLLNDYLRQAENEDYSDGYLKQWENTIFNAIVEKIY